jgi:hypothetical protein
LLSFDQQPSVYEPEQRVKPEQATECHVQIAHQVVPTCDVYQLVREHRLKLGTAQVIGHSFRQQDGRPQHTPYSRLDYLRRDYQTDSASGSQQRARSVKCFCLPATRNCPACLQSL